MPVPALALLVLALLTLRPPPVRGQPGQPGQTRQTGGDGRPPAVELAVGTWLPAPGIRLSADSDGAVGSEIDLRRDLALPRRGQWNVRLTLAPAPRHQFVAETLPVTAHASTTMARDVRFVGATYPAGQRLDSSLSWQTWRGGYRYAFVQRERMSAGLNLDLWYSDLRLRLRSATADREGRSRLPIPGLGTSVHYQVTPRVRVRGEGSLFVIPDQPDHHFGGRYVNLSGALTARVAGPLAVEAGVRWIDIRHLGEANTGFGRVSGVIVSAVLQR